MESPPSTPETSKTGSKNSGEQLSLLGFDSTLSESTGIRWVGLIITPHSSGLKVAYTVRHGNPIGQAFTGNVVNLVIECVTLGQWEELASGIWTTVRQTISQDMSLKK